MIECTHDNADTRKGRRCSSCQQNERYARDPEYRERRRRDSYKRFQRLDREAESKRRQSYRIRTNYGLSPERYASLLTSHSGMCDLCHKRSWQHIDHSHETGQFRGFVCARCNLWLAALDSVGWLDKANEYLRTRRND
jgi:hypothetical protein